MSNVPKISRELIRDVIAGKMVRTFSYEVRRIVTVSAADRSDDTTELLLFPFSPTAPESILMEFCGGVSPESPDFIRISIIVGYIERIEIARIYQDKVVMEPHWEKNYKMAGGYMSRVAAAMNSVIKDIESCLDISTDQTADSNTNDEFHVVIDYLSSWVMNYNVWSCGSGHHYSQNNDLVTLTAAAPWADLAKDKIDVRKNGFGNIFINFEGSSVLELRFANEYWESAVFIFKQAKSLSRFTLNDIAFLAEQLRKKLNLLKLFLESDTGKEEEIRIVDERIQFVRDEDTARAFTCVNEGMYVWMRSVDHEMVKCQYPDMKHIESITYSVYCLHGEYDRLLKPEIRLDESRTITVDWASEQVYFIMLKQIIDSEVSSSIICKINTKLHCIQMYDDPEDTLFNIIGYLDRLNFCLHVWKAFKKQNDDYLLEINRTVYDGDKSASAYIKLRGENCGVYRNQICATVEAWLLSLDHVNGVVETENRILRRAYQFDHNNQISIDITANSVEIIFNDRMLLSIPRFGGERYIYITCGEQSPLTYGEVMNLANRLRAAIKFAGIKLGNGSGWIVSG